MLELKGKYNIAKVFTDNIDNETISQLILLLNQPYIADSQIRIMPDTHAGAGCVIGTTMTLTDKVCPNLVGVDIGCSVSAFQLEETDVDLPYLDKMIHEFVPAGFNVHERAIAISSIKDMIAPINVEHALKSLGTLEGGNHFLEVDRDEQGHLWLVVHTGSRHLGIEVCKHYQNLAYKQHKSHDIQEKIQKTIAKLKSEGKERDIENAIKILKMQEPNIPKDLCYITGQDFENYLHDMKLTQEHARINHKTIADIILSKMNWHIQDEIHTMHNYIDIENKILRKGSVSTKAGERLIIPMNMRDGSLICIGKGNPDWNYSAPHGAGRIMSRSQAKDLVDMDDFKESMKGIYSTSVVESTKDESPFAYKPMDELKANIQDTVSIVSTIKPIYNFKAH